MLGANVAVREFRCPFGDSDRVDLAVWVLFVHAALFALLLCPL